MSTISQTIILIIIAYLIGSISSAVWVCRLRNLPDPRQQGSGNPGATNVLRIGGVSSAAMVFGFDVLKGAVPTYSAFHLGAGSFALGLIAIATCLGHIFPVFFGFKGGKGVATAFGAMAPIGGTLSLCLIVTWISVLLISRYSSLAAIVSALLAPAFTYWLDERFTLSVAMLSVMILLRHKANIERLLKGEESKVVFKRVKK